MIVDWLSSGACMQRQFSPKYTENSKAVQSTFRSLEIHFKGCNQYNLYLFRYPRATEIFSKLLGLQYYFPENFSRCNLKLYEDEDFSDSSLYQIQNCSGFPFYRGGE